VNRHNIEINSCLEKLAVTGYAETKEPSRLATPTQNNT